MLLTLFSFDSILVLRFYSVDDEEHKEKQGSGKEKRRKSSPVMMLMMGKVKRRIRFVMGNCRIVHGLMASLRKKAL